MLQSQFTIEKKGRPSVLCSVTEQKNVSKTAFKKKNNYLVLGTPPQRITELTNIINLKLKKAMVQAQSLYFFLLDCRIYPVSLP
jgi:hypothetical protein